MLLAEVARKDCVPCQLADRAELIQNVLYVCNVLYVSICIMAAIDLSAGRTFLSSVFIRHKIDVFIIHCMHLSDCLDGRIRINDVIIHWTDAFDAEV